MKKPNGYTALITVLIISAVLLLTVTSVAAISINEAQSGLAISQSEANLHLAEGCMEDALSRARSNSGYAGGTVSLPEGSCTITVNKAGNVWTITSTPTTTTYRRAVQVVATRTSTLVISSWKEI